MFASHTARTSPFRVGSHHLSRELARRGHSVVHVSTPLSPLRFVGSTGSSNLAQRWREHSISPWRVEENLVDIVPFTVVPVQGNGFLPRPVMTRTVFPGLRTTLAALDMADPDVLLVDEPLFAGLEDALAPRRLVYRPTDQYPGRLHGGAQGRLVSRADGVVATSEQVLRALPDRARQVPHVVLPNGVDLAHMSRAASGATRSGGVVYVGSMDDRFDHEWLAAVASLAPQVPFDLYGPQPPRRDRPANVRLCGALPYEDLPEVLTRYRVGLMPFRDVPENHGRSPMKMYEYLACGLFVVSTGAVRQVSAQGAPGVWDAPGAAAAARRISDLVATGTVNQAGADLAVDHGWAGITDRLETFLRSL
ncbi:glycosyltransferase [Kineococcus sp. SYSU DK006]|uniref:glycosyltransferase n=1 Tax=Kineococcus sp. SYSU DK006 TaxID=3383127 RepID=UPI003D7DCCAE